MTAKQKKVFTRIIISGIIFILLFFISHLEYFKDMSEHIWFFGISLVAYFIIGYDVILKAFRNIKNGQIFDENFLMMIATFGAFGIGEYEEAVAVMLFYQVGELFQGYAVGKSRQSISEMMDICPEYVNIEKNGELIQVDPDEIAVGTTIVVKPGERVPLDGIVLEGESYLDTVALTGESVPRKITSGEDIISGCVNGEGTLYVQVTKEFENSTVAQILELVENASSKKTRMENFISRFAKYYTPIVTIVALILAVIPPIILGGEWEGWIKRACIFLVISCPCALVISVPLGFFGGIGAASKLGILVKGSNYLEAVAEVTTVVFDKTGTLTKGDFCVTNVITETIDKDKLIEIAALAEGYSNHPLAKAIREVCHKNLDMSYVTNVKEISGYGIKACIDNKNYFIGNEKMMKENSISYKKCDSIGTILYIAEEQSYLGAIIVADSIKENAKQAIVEMKKNGIKQCVMLTGDKEEVAKKVGEQVGIDKVYAELLPGKKVEILEKILSKKNRNKDKLAFVGDGINDAPVLTRADVGIAMGSMGSDVAIEAADIVIMDDNIDKIKSIIKIARKTLIIVKENIVFALGIKLLVLLLGAVGMANMWEAVFADVGVSVIAILNAMRCLNTKKL